MPAAQIKGKKVHLFSNWLLPFIKSNLHLQTLFLSESLFPQNPPSLPPPPPPPAQFFGLDPKKARPTILPPNISFLSPPVLWIRTKTSHCFSPLNRCVTLISSCSSSFFFNSAVLSVQFRHDRSSGMDVLATV